MLVAQWRKRAAACWRRQCRPEAQGDYLASLGLKETGLARVVHAGYQLLDLVTFAAESFPGPRARGLHFTKVSDEDVDEGYKRKPLSAALAVEGNSGMRRAAMQETRGVILPDRIYDITPCSHSR